MLYQQCRILRFWSLFCVLWKGPRVRAMLCLHVSLACCAWCRGRCFMALVALISSGGTPRARRLVVVLAAVLLYAVVGSQSVQSTHLPCSAISRSGGSVSKAAMTGRPSTRVHSRRSGGDYGGFNRPGHRLAAIIHNDESDESDNSDEGFNLFSWTNRLVALNIVMFGLQKGAPMDIVTLIGIKSDIMIKRGEYHRFFTPMLLHADLMHLFFNSICMLSVGGDVESRFGARSFVPLYVFSGFCGNALSYASRTAPVSLGASGAISGLAGAFMLFAYRHRQFGDEMKDAFQSIAKTVMWNVFRAMSNSDIDNMAHLGGFLGGMAYAYVFGPRWLSIADSHGRTSLVDVPILHEWWARGVAELQKVGILLKSKRPAQMLPSLLQRVKSALNLPTTDNSQQRRPFGSSRGGTAMIATPSFQGARPVVRGVASGGRSYRVMRLHGSVLMPRHVVGF